MTTVYPASNYPTALDSFLPRLIDNTDEVIVNHQNTGFEAIENIQAKLGIDGDPIVGLGGVSFDPAGKAANPGAPGSPTLWVDNSGGPGFPLKYTDDTGAVLTVGESNWDRSGTKVFPATAGDYAEITIPDTTNTEALKLIQQDVTNNPAVLIIDNAGTGPSVSLEGSGSRSVNSDSADLEITTTTSGDVKVNSAGVVTFEDQYKGGSTYTGDFRVSASSAEWDTFESNMSGEVSILGGMNTLYTLISTEDIWDRTGTVIDPKNTGDTVQFSAGTVSLPGLAFVGDPDTGIYRSGTNELAIASAGQQVAMFASEQFLLNSAEGTITFENDSSLTVTAGDWAVDAVDIDITASANLDLSGISSVDIASSGGGVTVIASGDRLFLSGTNIQLTDSYRPSSTYSVPIKLANDTAEWDAFEADFGEVSLFNALDQLYDAVVAEDIWQVNSNVISPQTAGDGLLVDALNQSVSLTSSTDNTSQALASINAVSKNGAGSGLIFGVPHATLSSLVEVGSTADIGYTWVKATTEDDAKARVNIRAEGHAGNAGEIDVNVVAEHIDYTQTGSHDGGDGQAILTDTGASWDINRFVGYPVRNLTDGSSGTITANTATTVTATLSGGTDNDWDNGDNYSIDYVSPNDALVQILSTTAGTGQATMTIDADHGVSSGSEWAITAADASDNIPLHIIQNDVTSSPRPNALKISANNIAPTGVWSTTTGYAIEIDDSVGFAGIATGDQTFYFGGYATATERTIGMGIQAEGVGHANVDLGAIALDGSEGNAVARHTANVADLGTGNAVVLLQAVNDASTDPSPAGKSLATAQVRAYGDGEFAGVAEVQILSEQRDAGVTEASNINILASNAGTDGAATATVGIQAKTAINIGTDTSGDYDGDINIGTGASGSRAIAIGHITKAANLGLYAASVSMGTPTIQLVMDDVGAGLDTAFATTTSSFPVWGSFADHAHGNALISSLSFTGRDSASNFEGYGAINAYCVDNTSGDEDGSVQIVTAQNGTVLETALFATGVTITGRADSSFTIDGNNADQRTLTIATSNIGSGNGIVSIDAKTRIDIGTSTHADYPANINIGTNVLSGQRDITIGHVSKVGTLTLEGAAVASNSTWGINAPDVANGTHDGGDGSAVLIDSGASWTVNALVGRYVFNDTDGSYGLITANTATQITATLSGGTENDWDDGDGYSLDATCLTLTQGDSATYPNERKAALTIHSNPDLSAGEAPSTGYGILFDNPAGVGNWNGAGAQKGQNFAFFATTDTASQDVTCLVGAFGNADSNHLAHVQSLSRYVGTGNPEARAYLSSSVEVSGADTQAIAITRVSAATDSVNDLSTALTEIKALVENASNDSDPTVAIAATTTGGGTPTITVDASVISIDATDDSNFSMVATDAGTKTLLIHADNTGAGAGIIKLQAPSGALWMDGLGAVFGQTSDLTVFQVNSDTINLNFSGDTDFANMQANDASNQEMRFTGANAGAGDVDILFSADGATNFDAKTISIDATGVANLNAGASSDLTLGARGATITLNESGDTTLDGAFTATSIIGALNEVKGEVVAESLWDRAASILSPQNAGDGLSIDATVAISLESDVSSSLNVNGSDAGDLTLTLSSSNTGAGDGLVKIDADQTVFNGTATPFDFSAPQITFAGDTASGVSNGGFSNAIAMSVDGGKGYFVIERGIGVADSVQMAVTNTEVGNVTWGSLLDYVHGVGEVGRFQLNGSSDAGPSTYISYGLMQANCVDDTDGDEEGTIRLGTTMDGVWGWWGVEVGDTTKIDGKTAINIGTKTGSTFNADINIGTDANSTRTITVGSVTSSKVDYLYLRADDVQINAANEILLQQDTKISDGKNIVLDTTTGTKIGTATSQKLGFFNATPIVQPSAYTQTYSTADKTHAARTAAALTDSISGSVGTTLAAIPDPSDSPATADALRDDLVANVLPKIRDALSSIADQVNKLRDDGLDTSQVVNALIDDIQALGLAG